MENNLDERKNIIEQKKLNKAKEILERKQKKQLKERTEARSIAAETPAARKKREQHKKYLIIFILFVFLICIFYFTKDPIQAYINKTLEPKTIITEDVNIFPDITGFDEKDGISILKESGFHKIKTEYIYDQFSGDGAIVKCNYTYNTIVKKSDEIILYICDETLVSFETAVPSSDISADLSFYKLDGIKIISFQIEDEKFYAIIKNENNYAIKNINYAINYQNDSGESIENRFYLIDSEIILLPNEKISIEGNIKNNTASLIQFYGFNYESIPIASDIN